MKTSFLLPALGALLLSACASMSAGSPPVKTQAGMLTNQDGMTLYTFDRDASGKSNCNGPCAVNWPPLLASGNAGAAGDYSVVKRDDGRAQWAYKGKPLYTWIKDQKPGDKTGDGFNNNTWHVARP